MTNLWKRAQQDPSSGSIFDIDAFDLWAYDKAKAAVPGCKNAIGLAKRQYPGDAIQDSFLALHNVAPELKKNPGSLKPLAELVKRGQDTPEFNQLRESTVGSQVSSIFGAVHFTQQVLSNLPEEVKEAAKEAAEANAYAEEAEQKLDNLNAMSQMLEDGQEQGQPDPRLEQIQSEVEQLESELEDLEMEAIVTADNFDETLEANEAAIKATLNSAAKEAQEKAEEAQELVNAFGLAAGAKGEVDPETARDIMAFMENNPNLLELANYLGWAKRMVNGEWRKSSKGQQSLTGYSPQELHPSRLSSTERMAMVAGNEMQKIDFGIRLAQSALIHQNLDGEEPQGRGAMIYIGDQSGSMSGRPHSLSVALEWALLGIARRQKRNFVSIPFGGENQYHVWEASPVGKKGETGDLIKHLSHFYNGGTEPFRPLLTALNMVEKDGLKADILMVTDESFASPSDKFMERVKQVKQSTGVKIVVVRVDCNYGGNLPFADKTIDVTDFIKDKEQLKEAVSNIV